MGISCLHAKKNDTEHRSRIDRPHEDSGSPGKARREHDYGGALHRILEAARNVRASGAKTEEKLAAERPGQQRKPVSTA